MGRLNHTELLLALLHPGSDDGLDGDELTARLGSAGVTASPGRVLTQLLALEDSGHVHIERYPDYRFRLTPLGEGAAYDLGPGRSVDVTLVMADLVGFVAFTETEGDSAAHATALALSAAAVKIFVRHGGTLVKALGDGVLGTTTSLDQGVLAAQDLAAACASLDGRPWSLRAGIHHGNPVEHHGDLYGADVNLAARLCQMAEPGHALVTGCGGDPVEVRGLRARVDALAVAL